MNSKQQRILEILAEVVQVRPETIEPDHDLKSDLELDSAQALELLATIEDEFDREISEVEAAKVKTVQDILNFAPD